MPDEPRRGPDFTAESRETPGFVAFRKSSATPNDASLPLSPKPSQPLVLTFPGGSKIELGERETLEGRYPFISLTSPNDPSGLPSLTLWIDPISFQAMITIRSGPGWYQTHPLDKKFQSPYDKSWSPQGPAAHIGVPPTPPQNQASTSNP